MNRNQRNGQQNVASFTLIEMLVVIAVILILAGLLFTATTGAIRRNNRVKTHTDVVSLRTAIMAYYNEYGKPPTACGDGTAFPALNGGTANSQNNIIDVLRGGQGGCAVGKEPNPRKLQFLSINNRDIDGKGYFLDIWKKPYNIAFDISYNNKVETGAGDAFYVGTSASTATETGFVAVVGSVGAWSFGLNECDDAGVLDNNVAGCKSGTKKDDINSWD